MIPRLPPGFSHPMRIGGGAFASVYRVRQARVDRWVALKIIGEANRERRTAVLKEATTQAGIRVSCVPQVFDAFEWKRTVCIVMQWIKGAALDELLTRMPSREQRIWLADGFIRALAGLHGEGYAHRDLKPANVIISPDDGVFLVDFGLSKQMNDPEKTMSGIVKGTPAYMAPELWRAGGDVDHMRADVYSAGLILREILAGDEIVRIADSLTDQDPASRPASGQQVLSLWESSMGQSLSPPAWQTLAGSAAGELHAANLLAAARQLIAAGRADEAYWLLVECLEQDPNCSEAVELMNGFPVLSRRRAMRRSLAVAAVACIVALVVAAAFFAGRESRTWQKSARAASAGLPESGTNLLKSTRAGSPGGEAAAALLEDSIPMPRLAGYVLIKSCPSQGSLSIDGRAVASRDYRQQSIAISFGNHLLSWHVQGRGMVWRERISVLPFQVKGITIRALL